MSIIANKKVCIVFGGSRGIGESICKTLSKSNYHVVISAKTSSATQSSSLATSLPGTIEQVRDDIIASGGSASSRACDVRKVDQIRDLIHGVISEFGKVDAIVYNSGAIWWGPVESADMKRFDLLQEVNIRGFYAVVNTIMPHFRKNKSGRIVTVAPPIYSRFFRGKTSYAIGKVGMTVLTMGLAMDLDDSREKDPSENMAISAIWPATAVSSAVTDKMKVNPGHLRKPEIFADAVLGILEEQAQKVNGLALVDEDFLREFKGVTDFSKYREDPNVEPPRMLPKKFPSLLVEEQADRGMTMTSKPGKAKL
ncbi:hypothetical protein HDU76_011423 [Blyttiomyces sp. JEL0837]|nr:hypothetical protein HDU76_011423 [Blyttiomyces sp. JEL0837]